LVGRRLEFDQLLHRVHQNLQHILLALHGDLLMTDELLELSTDIIDNKVPKTWKINMYNSHRSLTAWLNNLQQRIHFLSFWIHCLEMKNVKSSKQVHSIWLSAFMYPQGILTAILQNYSRENNLPIDSLSFEHEVTSHRWLSDKTNPYNFDACDKTLQEIAPPSVGVYIMGLFLDGACWNHNHQHMDRLAVGERVSPLPLIHFIPVLKSNIKPHSEMYDCPLYQTSQRKDRLIFSNFVTSISLQTEVPSDDWVLNGVAALCQSDDD
jgi:dynein heavy chain